MSLGLQRKLARAVTVLSIAGGTALLGGCRVPEGGDGAVSEKAVGKTAARNVKCPVAVVGGGQIPDRIWEWMLRAAVKHAKVEPGSTKEPMRVLLLTADNPDEKYKKKGYLNEDQNLNKKIESILKENDLEGRYSEVKSGHVYLYSRDAILNSSINRLLREAAVVFIKGGDQKLYRDLWGGSDSDSVENQIKQACLGRGAVVGGTSAGAHVLGKWGAYPASGSVSAGVVLKDAFPVGEIDQDHPKGDLWVNLDDHFLGLIPSAIVSTHFTSRCRIGRIIPFMARILNPWNRDPLGFGDPDLDLLGIGLDEGTSLVIEPGSSVEIAGKVLGEDLSSGSAKSTQPATIIGAETVTFLHRIESDLTDEDSYSFRRSEIRVQSMAPPIMTSVRTDILTEGHVVDLGRNPWAERQSSFVLRRPHGVVEWPNIWRPSRSNKDGFEIRGNSSSDARYGQLFTTKVMDLDAIKLGKLGVGEASRNGPMLSDFFLETMIDGTPDDDEKYHRKDVENRCGGPLWGMHNRGHRENVNRVLLLDSNGIVDVSQEAISPRNGKSSVILVDASMATTSSQSRYSFAQNTDGKLVGSPEGGTPSQFSGVEGAVTHVFAHPCRYVFDTGQVDCSGKTSCGGEVSAAGGK